MIFGKKAAEKSCEVYAIMPSMDSRIDRTVIISSVVGAWRVDIDIGFENKDILGIYWGFLGIEPDSRELRGWRWRRGFGGDV